MWCWTATPVFTLPSTLEVCNFFLFVAFSSSVFLVLFCLAVQAAVGTAGNQKSGCTFFAILVRKQWSHSTTAQVVPCIHHGQGQWVVGRVNPRWAGMDRLMDRYAVHTIFGPVKLIGRRYYSRLAATDNRFFPLFFPKHLIFLLLSGCWEILYKYNKICLWTEYQLQLKPRCSHSLWSGMLRKQRGHCSY